MSDDLKGLREWLPDPGSHWEGYDVLRRALEKLTPAVLEFAGALENKIDSLAVPAAVTADHLRQAAEKLPGAGPPVSTVCTVASIRDAVCLEIADELERYFAGLGFLTGHTRVIKERKVHEAIKRLREGRL